MRTTHGAPSLGVQSAYKWGKSLSEVTGWVPARMVFAILRATNLCLRDSRKKWRSGTGMDDVQVYPLVRIKILWHLCTRASVIYNF